MAIYKTLYGAFEAFEEGFVWYVCEYDQCHCAISKRIGAQFIWEKTLHSFYK